MTAAKCLLEICPRPRQKGRRFCRGCRNRIFKGLPPQPIRKWVRKVAK